jgi:hypothetical protein
LEIQKEAIPARQHFHVPKGTATSIPLVSESHSSISALLLPVFNLFAEEFEAQRTGRLIKVDILALKLIALYKQIAFLTAEGRFIL